MKSACHIITTGGTIDVAAIDISGNYNFGQSMIPSVIKQGGIQIPIRWTHLPPIDSLCMDNPYRDTIIKACNTAAIEKILIIHGTDTMVETAQYLVGKIPSKVVILVGAMIPLKESNTDGYMNLGYAVGILSLQYETGVFIAMNGQIFSPENVRKNREASRFETIR